MIVISSLCYLVNTADHSGFWVMSAINQSPNAGMYQSPSAHHTWLQSDIQVTIDQPVITEGFACSFEGLNFCMGARIVETDDLIVSMGNDFT